MAAFDRVLSGIPQMDACFDNIRLGDNVVWRVDRLEDFRLFAKPYVEQAIRDKRNLIYIRFASHEPFFTEREGLKIVNVELSHRFETFTVDIHEIIRKEGVDAFYVFDCLSELQTAWATDLMMGNFFQVTCPYLFQLDTVAFFPLIRGKHSFHAIAKIRDTTQLFLDVYSDKTNIYVRPDKVWNRYSETMFLPHRYEPEKGEFAPILDGVVASHFYQLLEHNTAGADRGNKDSWDRFFEMAETMHENGLDVTEQCSRMCNIMMTRDERLRVMIKENFKAKDYLNIKKRMLGTGMIGGKATGMLLARKIIENKRPDIFACFEPHDSFFIGSDVFYTFIVENHFWDIRVRQRSKEEYFSLADEFAARLRAGKFSRDMEEEFVKLLEYYGQDPIIVRSSSILEDGFGNAFAGKYESVFCPNAGDMEQRLQEFEDAVRTVYASTMSKSALDYRSRRGLQARDEQMALLVQRVSGSYYGDYYMPCAAGVGYSYSPYRFLESLDPSAGMLRLVMGLGTSAVDRTEGSYPRLVSLDQPKASVAQTSAEKHQFSQRKLELINRGKGKLEQVSLEVIEPYMPYFLKRLLLEHDFDAERSFRERGQNIDIEFISCQGIVNREVIMQQMKDILVTIQEAYQYPVDTEFTINLSENGDYVINILQCRPLQVFRDSEETSMPEHVAPDSVLFECRNSAMGLSRTDRIDLVVYVDPVSYYNMPYRDKYRIARAIGTVNWTMRGKDRKMLLMV
ncbi:MAG: phosphoenolpyruvate synthase, partial [Lachnospiraceae bacterium]|nr:phosphoenolpyruvate synthase [Lachnospiraceae bacterium]